MPKTEIFMPALGIQRIESLTKIELISFSKKADGADEEVRRDGEVFIRKGIKMVIEMAETFQALKAEMRREILPKVNCMTRNVRPFRQKFCRLARKTKGLSLENLCHELNQHPEILKLEKLPGFKYFYPITPELIEKLENKISQIPEYQPFCAGFFAIGIVGTPTKDIAAVIAKVCDVTEMHREFVHLSLEYEFGYETVASWGSH